MLVVWLNESNFYEEPTLWELVRPKRPVIINTIQSDPRLYPQVREILIEENFQTLIVFPLVALAEWVGCLFVYYQQEHHFDHIDLRHLKVLVDQASITLYNLKLLLAEEDLRREAERANEIKSQFLAMISHELRTPLTSIIGFTTTMLAKDVHWEPEDQLDFIQTIQSEGFRLQELIDHLLDLSRLEAGILPISPQPVSFHEIMEDAMPQLHILASGKTLSIQVPSNLPQVFADTKRISQVLVNLVRNAAAYSPRGTEIKITANIQKAFLKINVIDQGPGIPPSDHNRVFRAFQRGTIGDNELFKGAGLGLAICKGLVDAHNGRIWINKKTTPGTTISFTLPLVSQKCLVKNDRGDMMGNILIVEDDPNVRKLVRVNLVKRGYTVSEAEDSHQALALFQSVPVDLVLLDLVLPGLSGVDICVWIRARSEVPIIILSARLEEDLKVAALDAGADDYVTKPFSSEELLARVRAFLRRSYVTAKNDDNKIQIGELKIDLDARRVFIKDRDLHLTRTEYALMAVLTHHLNAIVTHDELLVQVWGPEYRGSNHYLHTYLGSLAKKTGGIW